MINEDGVKVETSLKPFYGLCVPACTFGSSAVFSRYGLSSGRRVPRLAGDITGRQRARVAKRQDQL